VCVKTLETALRLRFSQPL